MTPRADELTTKRAKRNRGRERERHAEADVAAELADWEALHEIAQELPHWKPGDLGRPPLMPPALILLFGIMRWGWGSDRKTADQFKHRTTWEAVRSAMFRRYPHYKGVQPGSAPITRSQVWQYRQFHGIDDSVFERLLEAFRRCSADLALSMGMFNPEQANVTHPEPTTFLAGDCTTFTSRYNAACGERQSVPETGEIIDKLFDPDALSYQTYDEFGNEKRETVYGTKFAILHARLPFDGEQVITDILHVRGGHRAHESAVIEDAVQQFQCRAPGLSGLVYDMAIRGSTREKFYRSGLLTITKVPRTKKNEPRTRKLGELQARKGGRRVGLVTAWAYEGAVAIEAIARGETHYVTLNRVRTSRHKNKGRNGRRYRWYNHLRIPDDPLIPPHLRGAQVIVRIDDPDAEAGRVSWADSLHAIAPGEADWERLFDLRNPTESINWWIKSRLQGKRRRAPAVGAKRTHFALLCAALYNNFQALTAFASRHLRAAA